MGMATVYNPHPEKKPTEKRKMRSLVKDLKNFVRSMSKEENGAHNPLVYDSRKAGCGICVTVRMAHDLAIKIEQDLLK